MGWEDFERALDFFSEDIELCNLEILGLEDFDLCDVKQSEQNLNNLIFLIIFQNNSLSQID